MAIAQASQILNGKTGYDASGNKITGSISNTKSAQTYYVSTSNRSISAGTYLTGDQTIYGISENTYNYEYRAGYSYGIYDNNGSSVHSGAGTYTKTPSSGQTLATAGTILSGYSGWANGSEIIGTMTSSDLNPYVVMGDTTISQSGKKAIATTVFKPSSGNGASAAYTATAEFTSSSNPSSVTITRSTGQTATYTMTFSWGKWTYDPNNNLYQCPLLVHLVSGSNTYDWQLGGARTAVL